MGAVHALERAPRRVPGRRQPNAEKTPVTQAILAYHRQLRAWRDKGHGAKADAHEALHAAVLQWRAALVMVVRDGAPPH